MQDNSTLSVASVSRALLAKIFQLLSFFRLETFCRAFRVPLTEWPPSPTTIRRCAPALFVILFLPKFGLDIRRLFSAIEPDKKKVTKNARTFVTATKKSFAVVKRSNENLPRCIEDCEIAHEDYAPAKRPQVWNIVDAEECATNHERFVDALDHLKQVMEPDFLTNTPLSSFDLLVRRKEAEKKAKAAAASAAAAAVAANERSSSRLDLTPVNESDDGGATNVHGSMPDESEALKSVEQLLASAKKQTTSAAEPGSLASDPHGGIRVADALDCIPDDIGSLDDAPSDTSTDKVSQLTCGDGDEQYDEDDDADDDDHDDDDDVDEDDGTEDIDDSHANEGHGTSREREINDRHASVLALLGSIKSAYNDLVDALLEQDTQEKVYNIQAEEEKMLQAATSTYILLGHATALCYSVFAETVYLTSEGVVEKFKDGQELRTLWSRYISFFLYELRWTVPYTEMRKDPVCIPSRDHKSSNVCPMKSRASPAMQFMLRRSLGLLEGMLRQRDSVLRKLKMGDFRKVFRFTRMILGQPRNWLLTGMSWVLTVMTSAVGSSSFHYRNLLISVVKASLEGSPSENFRYERGVDASIDLATSALARVPTTISGKATVPASATMHWSEKFRSVARRILLGHDRPTKVALKKGASPLGLGLGTRLGEVLFAVFFMEILQVLLEDLTEKCKNMGIAAIEDRLSKKLVRVVLAQDLEDVQKAEQPHNRKGGPLTPKQLIHDVCEEENGIVGGILDIPLRIISATSTALTTGLLLWSKNRTLLMSLLAMSAVTYRAFDGVRHGRDWLGARLGVNVDDKYECSVAELDLLDGVENFKDMRVNGNEHYHYEQYQSSKSHTQRSRDRADTLASLFLPFENLVQQTPMLFSYWLGGWLVLNDGLAAGDLANFLETTRQLIKELRSSYRNTMELVRLNGPNIRRATAIVDLFDQTPKIGIDGGERLTSLSDGTVEFKNVTFSRPDWPLDQQGITFRVPSGSFVAVCGRNGSGKSTLFSLLLRLYEADSGEILIGGRSVRDINPVDLRSQIAMAIQSPGMKMDCIRANCIYGSEHMFEHSNDPDFMDTKIHEALEKLDAWNMFSDPKTFPEGIDSYKWELSGGQKRIIGLVRAIIRDSKILLLDEPTNDLDPDRQEAVKENLFRKRGAQTVMCITHDISLIREADKIIFLAKDPVTGVTTISEQGTYDELKGSGGTFQQWHEFKTNAHRKGHHEGHGTPAAPTTVPTTPGGETLSTPTTPVGPHQSPADTSAAATTIPADPVPLARVRSFNRAPPKSPPSPRGGGQRSPSVHRDERALD